MFYWRKKHCYNYVITRTDTLCHNWKGNNYVGKQRLIIGLIVLTNYFRINLYLIGISNFKYSLFYRPIFNGKLIELHSKAKRLCVMLVYSRVLYKNKTPTLICRVPYRFTRFFSNVILSIQYLCSRLTFFLDTHDQLQRFVDWKRRDQSVAKNKRKSSYDDKSHGHRGLSLLCCVIPYEWLIASCSMS